MQMFFTNQKKKKRNPHWEHFVKTCLQVDFQMNYCNFMTESKQYFDFFGGGKVQQGFLISWILSQYNR